MKGVPEKSAVFHEDPENCIFQWDTLYTLAKNVFLEYPVNSAIDL